MPIRKYRCKNIIISFVILFIISVLPCAYGADNKCMSGDCKNGTGTYAYSDGSKYTGEWKNGQRSGQGTFTHHNGSRYVGDWKNDKPDGQGTFTYADGSKYVGDWKNDKIDGQGTFTYADGSKYAGEWKDGTFNGQGTFAYADGSKYTGEWKDGANNGRGIFTWSDGVSYEGMFVNGKAQPPYEFLRPDGTRHGGTMTIVPKIRYTIDKSQSQSVGLKAGDIVVEYNKDIIMNSKMLVHLVSQTKPEENVNMIVQRQGKELNFTLKGGKIGIALMDTYEYSLKDQSVKKEASSSTSIADRNEANKEKVTDSKPDRSPKVDFGKYYALVIGNDNYSALPKLQTAKNDARSVANILKNNYGFNVTLLLDAKRSDILVRLSKLRETLSAGDNLLIYYAGHGFLDKDGDEGYWLPVDATKDNEVNWISNSSLTTQLKAMEARHVIVIADSCYSGKLGRSIHIQKRSPDYYSRIVQKRSRSVIASGGLEPVIDSGGKGDHSVFASALISALQENASIIDGSELFNTIRRPVVLNADQTPEYADIRKAGHEGGEFVFVRQK